MWGEEPGMEEEVGGGGAASLLLGIEDEEVEKSFRLDLRLMGMLFPLSIAAASLVEVAVVDAVILP
jgi:hypothetical protein